MGRKRSEITAFWTLCPKVESVAKNVYDNGMEKDIQEFMEKKIYISEEERKKCKAVADAFAELEDADIVVVDVGRYGFVKLQYYTPPTGFENDVTFTDSRELFEDLWEEWLHTQLVELARKMFVQDIDYDSIFRQLPKERQKELESRKKEFAEKVGIIL